MSPRHLALLVAGAILAGGCGSTTGASDKVSSTVSTFIASCAQGRYLEAAGMLSDADRRWFTEQPDKDQACAKIVGLGTASSGAGAKALLGSAQPATVTVDGDEAAVAVGSSAGSGPAFDVEFYDGEWWISTQVG